MHCAFCHLATNCSGSGIDNRLTVMTMSMRWSRHREPPRGVTSSLARADQPKGRRRTTRYLPKSTLCASDPGILALCFLKSFLIVSR